jgi:GNAT superfamily N-acetyltransferase
VGYDIDYNIVDASINDLTFLSDIEYNSDQLFKDYGLDAIIYTPKNPLSYWLDLYRTSIIRIAKNVDGTVLGFYMLAEIDRQSYLKQISVDPQYGSKGIGTKLLLNALHTAKSQGHNYVTLTTYRDINFNAPFYRKNGFEEFTPDDTWPELSKLRAEEKSSDLEKLPRCAMYIKI